MKVALIYPPFHHRRFSENLKVIDEEFVCAPPIILAYVAAVMEKAGHEVLLVDAQVTRASKEEVLRKVSAFGADMLAFRLDTYNFQETLEWIGYLKAATGLPVLAGGINMSLYPAETMSRREIDFALEGEAVGSLPLFLRAFEENKGFENVPGLYRRNADGEVLKGLSPAAPADLDSYPFPARHLLDNGAYNSFVSQQKNYTVMLASTGCPFRCKFCAIAGLKQYRERSWENVIAEIEQCYYDFGVREIDFFDGTFFVNREKSLKLFEEINSRGIKIDWTCRSRVNLADETLLRKAAGAGCRMIFWGIESGAQRTLDAVNKQISLAQAETAVKAARSAGIRSLGFLMIGNPGETAGTVAGTMKFAKKLDLDYVQICRTIPKPGTELHGGVAAATGYDYWREFVLGNVGEERLPTPWTGLGQQELESLLKRAYYGFYFRPSFILKTALKVRSFAELARYFRVAVRMLFHYLYTDAKWAGRSELLKGLAHSGVISGNGRKTIAEKKVYVVVPSFNESGNAAGLVMKILALYPGINVIAVDSNSTDGTYDELKELSCRYEEVSLVSMEKKAVSNERGNSVREGVRIALSRGADMVIEMDSDLSHDPVYIGELIGAAGEYDVVIGSRYAAGGGETGRGLLRRAVSRLANLYIRYSLGITGVLDCTSGYRCYTKDSLEKIGYGYMRAAEGTEALVETLYRVMKNGFRIKEVPIIYRERENGASKRTLETFFRSMAKVACLRG